MTKNNIANKIKELRIINGLTQQEFAEILYTYQPIVSKWERGEATPNILTLTKIAKLANITLEELLEKETPKENALSETAKENLKIIRSYAYLAKTGQFTFDEINFANLVYGKVTEILGELGHERID